MNFNERLATSIMFNSYKLAVLGAAMVLGGCSVAGNGLWPETTEDGAAPAAITATSTEAPSETPSVTPSAWVEPIAPATPLVLDLPADREVTETGTFAGKKVAALRSDLNLLVAMVTAQSDEFRAINSSAAQSSQRYQASVSGVRSGLYSGATSGSPVLVAQLQSAQQDLFQIAGGKPRLTNLSSRVAANAGLASYVSNSARAAMGVHGAVDLDREQLTQIVADAAQVMTENDRLMTEISATIARNEALVIAETTNLSTLVTAVSAARTSVVNRPMVAMAGSDGALISIGFGRAKLEYEQALYDAVSTALNQRPDALFELVAVMPQRSGSGQDMKQNTRRVFKSLVDMGLPTNRVTLTAETSNVATTGEVQVHAR